jgi:purine-binding chemotaxis protein CheW
MNTAAETLQYLTFVIAGEEYAVDILTVREILTYETLTKIPKVPPFIRGVMNVRGSVIPVIDLAFKLAVPASAVTKRTCVIILDVTLGGEGSVVGFLVDSVNEVADLGPDDIGAVPSFGTRLGAEFLRGIGRINERFALILDLDRVLTHLEQLTANALSAEATATGEEPKARRRNKSRLPTEAESS